MVYLCITIKGNNITIKINIMTTIYQIYTNGIPTKSVFNNEPEALKFASSLKLMYKKVSIESFNVPIK